MKLFLMSLVLLVALGFCFVKRAVVAVKTRPTGRGGVKVVVIVRDQELWVEGFICKLFSRIKNMPQAEVLVVDDYSSDQTPQILSCLQNKYSFEFLGAGETVAVDEPKNMAGVIRFDARGLKGKELLRAPLFCHLSCLNRR